MLWRRVLIVAAVVVATALSLDLCIRSNATDSLISLYKELDGSENYYLSTSSVNPFSLGYDDQSESTFPFVWQRAKRERLRALLHRPKTPPTGTDELSQALFAEYAMRNADEKTLREGIRREPHNALYHYLLADRFISQGLKGWGPRTDKKTGILHYDYTITDRRKLDLGMREVAIGSRLPYRSHRDVLLRARLDSIHPTEDLEGCLQASVILASTLLPDYAKIRNLARVNGFYLSTLLAEGKRADAEPFLHAGEHLVVQMSNDTPPTLIAQSVAMAVGSICKKNDARVCRTFGFNREAAMIESRQEVLIGAMREWKEHGRKRYAKKNGALIRQHAGMLPELLLPVYGTQPRNLITEDTLRPSRLLEYVAIEKGVATVLCLFAFLLLVYAGLKIWCWKLAARGDRQPAPEMKLTTMEWLRTVGYGLLAPLALYLLYIAIPGLSGRDHGLRHAYVQFGLGLLMFTAWSCSVPTTMAAGFLWRRGIALGLVTNTSPWRTRISRLVGSSLSVGWCVLAFGFLLPTTCLLLLTPALARSPFINSTKILVIGMLLLLTLAVPMLLAIVERKHAKSFPHLAVARTMTMLYAMMTLCFAALIPVCAAFERHYVRTDTIMAPMHQGKEISCTKVEAQLVFMLRQGVRDGATKLGISGQ